MDEFIEQGSKLYDSETLAWNRGDVLGIASAQQAQRSLESELYSQETVQRKSSRFGKIVRPVLAGASIVLGAMAGVVYDNKIGPELVEDKIVYSEANVDNEAVDNLLYHENFSDLEFENWRYEELNSLGLPDKYTYQKAITQAPRDAFELHESMNPYITIKSEGYNVFYQDPAVFWYDGGNEWAEYSIEFKMNVRDHGSDCISNCPDNIEWKQEYYNNSLKILVAADSGGDESFENSYVIELDQNRSINLYKYEDGVRLYRGSIGYPIEEDAWQDIKIEYSPTELVMSVNDSTVFHYNIDEREKIMKGTFGFATQGVNALTYHFDEFKVRGKTLDELLSQQVEEGNLSEIQENLTNGSSNNVTLNRSELSFLLYKILELEDRMSEREDSWNQTNQTLAEVRQDWSDENETQTNNLPSTEPGRSEGSESYTFWIGTAAATLTVGGFLLQNKQIRALKRRALDPISELAGFDTDNSKSVTLSRETVGIDPQGNVVVHVHGDQYNTMMQAAREANVDAHIGGKSE